MAGHDRLDRLEGTLARLARELAEARSELERIRSGGASGSPGGAEPFRRPAEPAPASGVESLDRAPGPAGQATRPVTTLEEVLARMRAGRLGGGSASRGPAGPPPGVARGGGGLEQLVGRYGTLALAAVTILLGVGAFVGWAIRHGLIGPWLRIALGTAGATVLASVGWRLRARDDRRFGNLLLALALAMMHVVAWGAGPRLRLIPDIAALGVAAIASAALAWLAWRDEEQPLFNLGFGGALLAPFVTASGPGDAVILLTFGLLVLGGGLAALSRREWSGTPVVVMAGTAIYAVVAANQLAPEAGFMRANAAAIFGLGVASFALVLLLPPRRSGLTYLALSATLYSLVAASSGPSWEAPQYALAIALTAVAFAAAGPGEGRLRNAFLGAFVLPLGGMAVALGSLERTGQWPGALTALLWAGFMVVAATLNRDGHRTTHTFTGTLALGLSIAILTDERTVLMCALLAVLGGGTAFASRRWMVRGLAPAGAMWLVAATVRAFGLLQERAAFEYVPFLTMASVAGAAVSLGWVVASWHLSRLLPEGAGTLREAARVIVRIFGGLIAFLWGREELSSAISPDVSVFLLVAYYAVAAVLAIHVGRSRAVPALRHAGLAMSVYTAFKTIAESGALAIGWRVAAFLLAGLFLLAVAWWYRAASPARDQPVTAGP